MMTKDEIQRYLEYLVDPGDPGEADEMARATVEDMVLLNFQSFKTILAHLRFGKPWLEFHMWNTKCLSISISIPMMKKNNTQGLISQLGSTPASTNCFTVSRSPAKAA